MLVLVLELALELVVRRGGSLEDGLVEQGLCWVRMKQPQRRKVGKIA